MYTLIAQPIADDGSIGFDHRAPIEVTSALLDLAFTRMALELDRLVPDENEPNAHTGLGAAWDLTLTVTRS